ncbi:MAG: UPF0223 family protein [Thomasclavelia sp.]|nr:UPF0223 family protein [Thomasclavelia sp.]
MDYDYPLDISWSTEEILKVMSLYNAVEKAYEEGINKDEFKIIYNDFKTVVDSKSEEKQLDKKFKEVSGYSIYQVVKTVNNTNDEMVKL